MKTLSSLFDDPRYDEDHPEHSKFIEDFEIAKNRLKDKLSQVGMTKFRSIGGDYYDNSIEFYDVDSDVRLNESQQTVIFDEGFSTAYVNHVDGWETHYNWKVSEPFKKSRGWRRRYVTDSSVKTTRALGDDPVDERGYYEISYWPEGWGSNDWLTTGYMRIVPDHLEQDNE
jgi:hypothetical protein